MEQGVAVNEGVPTAESPTALDVVPTAESPVTNKDVTTDESPTEVVGVPTTESPTLQKFRDEQAFRINARNLLVELGHMVNEGNESQVNSLLPSNIDIKKSRRVTFFVDLVNEGAQISTSMPSEGESLGNIVDVDPISRPNYEPIDMTTVVLRISKRRKSKKNKCYSTIKNIGFTAYCAFATMTTVVRGQIAKISVSREIQNVQRAHSKVDWTRNICQPMALITAIIGKDTLTYGEMKRQPGKPQL